jgi:hypothetical protein
LIILFSTLSQNWSSSKPSFYAHPLISDFLSHFVSLADTNLCRPRSPTEPLARSPKCYPRTFQGERSLKSFR